jgi:hypothetical protein
MADLRRLAELGVPTEEVAGILLREVDEVGQKLTELKSDPNSSI